MGTAKKQSSNKVISTDAAAKWYSLNPFKARLIIIIACVVCYGNTVFNDFSLDDDFAYTRNSYVQEGLAGIPGILTHSYLRIGDKVADYRPIVGITYAIEYQFFGNNAAVGHVINLLLFIIFCLIAFGVLERILVLGSYPPLLALIIMVLYVAHPVHTEVVSSIKNRDEILSFIFAFLAIRYTLEYFSRGDFKVAPAAKSIGFMLIALFSKLTCLPVVGIILLTGLFVVHPAKKKMVYRFTAIVVGLALTSAVIILFNIKRQNFFVENPLSVPQDFSVRLGTTLETLFFYFRFMLVPYPHRFYYGYNTLPLLHFWDNIAIISFILYTGLLVYGVISFSKKQINGFFVLAFLASIILYNNLTTVYPGIVAERVLFAGSLWFIAAAVIFLYHLGGFNEVKRPASFIKNVITALGVVVLTGYSWLTIQRNFEWKDALTVMGSDIRHLENSTLANYFYASLLQQTGEKATDTSRNGYLQKAKKYYRQSLAVSPEYPEPYYKLGMIYEYDEHRNDSAFYCFKKGYYLDTTLVETQFQLAKLYVLDGKYKLANPLLEGVYRKVPTDTFTLFFYAQSLFFDGDTAGANKFNDKLLAIAPNYYEAYLNRGMFNKIAGNTTAAIPDLERAFQLGCTEPVLFNTLLNYYLETGQSDKANILQLRARR